MILPSNRRDFLKLSLQSGLTFLSFSPLAEAARNFMDVPPDDLLAASPLRPVAGPFSNTDFNGDDIKRPHDRLWNLQAYIASRGGRPPVSERRDVVIVGGGIGGLSSAYFLQGKNPLVLEQDAQFGGNSRGETFDDSVFSIGAAYISTPEKNGTLFRMLQNIGALNAARHENGDEARFLVKGRGFQSLWNGEIDPANREIIRQVAEDFARINQQAYPTIPWRPGGLSRPELDQLDQLNFQQWLTKQYGDKLPVCLKEFFQLYCWSTFASSVEEVSAAQAINFLASESEGLIAFPGGNSYVARGLLQFLSRRLSPNSLRPGVLVLEIKTVGDEVQLLVEKNDQLQTIACRACVVAAPKYVAQYIVPGMTPLQRQTARQLQYRAFIVANVLVNAKAPSPTFDAFRLEGEVPPSPTFGHPSLRPFTDVCFANWAGGDRSNRTVLTLYRPFPYDARTVLASASAFNRLRGEFLQGAAEVLEAMRVPSQTIAGIRLTRWGHAVPMAQAGFLASHADEVFKQPTDGRIFYANQDNDANPSFESAFHNAEIAAANILRLL
ncbi:MAG: FAD-dependent oxidoreductase [Bdellovibrionaceae bacterium]|nr:FAD-dependent oxidoreductase [Pseudobdellovibrionaceae bacterium]MBX3033946.1 FAD-dependent oxidoreductase [Pseudobdellovibrionaceae bacterium]